MKDTINIPDLAVEDTALSKSSELPQRFFMYSTFQKLVEATVKSDIQFDDPNAQGLKEFIQDSVDSALVSILAEMSNDPCFTIAEA